MPMMMMIIREWMPLLLFVSLAPWTQAQSVTRCTDNTGSRKWNLLCTGDIQCSGDYVCSDQDTTVDDVYIEMDAGAVHDLTKLRVLSSKNTHVNQKNSRTVDRTAEFILRVGALPEGTLFGIDDPANYVGGAGKTALFQLRRNHHTDRYQYHGCWGTSSCEILAESREIFEGGNFTCGENTDCELTCSTSSSIPFQNFDIDVRSGAFVTCDNGGGTCSDTQCQSGYTLFTQSPTPSPTNAPTKPPTSPPTRAPTRSPTGIPTSPPTRSPTHAPTKPPTRSPTGVPTRPPTQSPSKPPTQAPTKSPTLPPTRSPTQPPTRSPSKSPTQPPTRSPSNYPTKAPTNAPTKPPTQAPSQSPSQSPSDSPTVIPTNAPTDIPTRSPSRVPTAAPTRAPTAYPTRAPTRSPSRAPSDSPTRSPSKAPTGAPTRTPSAAPSASPTMAPTVERFAELVLYYNHSIDFFETDLFEYVDVLNEAVKRALLATINDTKPRDNDTYNRIETAVGGVDMCAVFSLNLYCDERDFDGEDVFTDDNYDSVDQETHQANFYASGMIIYGGDDGTDTVRKSRLINGLITNNLLLFKTYIEEFMDVVYGNWLARNDDRRRLQGDSDDDEFSTAFVIGDFLYENLQFAGGNKNNFDSYEATVNYIQYTMFAGIAIVLILVIMTKSHSLTIGADTTHPSGLIFFTLYVWDFYSDLFFVIRCVLVGAYDCFSVALFFTIVPYVLNLRELFIWEKKWMKDLTIKQGLTEYLDKYGHWLVFCSLISGSSFATIEMVNSNMFGIRFFSMGLTDRHMKRYNTRRLYSNILTENIPQLIIQVWYTLVYGGVINKGADAIDSVVIYAFCSSVVSIMVSVIDVYSSRKLIRHMKDANMYYQDDEITTFGDRSTISNSISNKTFYIVVESIEIEERRKTLLQRTGPIREALGEIIEIHSRSINLQQFVPKYTGVRIAFTVFSDQIPKEEITTKLCKGMQNGQIAESIQFGWKLLYLPEVTSIETLVGNLICPVRPDGTIVHPETGEPIIEGDLRVDEYGRTISLSVVAAETGAATDFAEMEEDSESDSIYGRQATFTGMFGFGPGKKSKKKDKRQLTDRTANADGRPAADSLAAPPPPSTSRPSFAKRMSGMFTGFTINLGGAGGSGTAASAAPTTGPSAAAAASVPATVVEQPTPQSDGDSVVSGPAHGHRDRIVSDTYDDQAETVDTMAPPPPSTDRPSYAFTKRFSGMGKRMSGMFSRPQQSTMQQLESAQAQSERPMAVAPVGSPGYHPGYPPSAYGDSSRMMIDPRLLGYTQSERMFQGPPVAGAQQPPYPTHPSDGPPFQMPPSNQFHSEAVMSAAVHSVPSSAMGAIPPTDESEPSTSVDDDDDGDDQRGAVAPPTGVVAASSATSISVMGPVTGGSVASFGRPGTVSVTGPVPPYGVSPYSSARSIGAGAPPFAMPAPYPSGGGAHGPPPFAMQGASMSETQMGISPAPSPMHSPMHSPMSGMVAAPPFQPAGQIPGPMSGGGGPPFQPSGQIPGPGPMMAGPMGGPGPMMMAGPPHSGGVPPPFAMPTNKDIDVMSDSESSMESEYETETDEEDEEEEEQQAPQDDPTQEISLSEEDLDDDDMYADMDGRVSFKE